jgi:hypothetical protein
LLAAPSATLLLLRLPTKKRHIMARRTDRYPWILYCWIAYFVKNTDMVEVSLHFQETRSQTHQRPSIPETQSTIERGESIRLERRQTGISRCFISLDLPRISAIYLKKRGNNLTVLKLPSQIKERCRQGCYEQQGLWIGVSL